MAFLNLETLACCAVVEMGDIQYFKTPTSALKALCKASAPATSRWGEYNDDTADWIPGLQLSSFYTFSGIEEVKGGNVNRRGVPVGYASKLAAFIRENRLGTVAASPARTNRLNHPTHVVKVFLWTPAKRNLEAWYKKHGGRVNFPRTISNRSYGEGGIY